MADDYISRKAAAEILELEYASTEIDEIEECMIRCVRRLKAIPAADVVERKRGEWVGYPECMKYVNAYSDDHIVCSECEECFSVLDNCTERFNFCPHCGADMRPEPSKEETI